MNNQAYQAVYPPQPQGHESPPSYYYAPYAPSPAAGPQMTYAPAPVFPGSAGYPYPIPAYSTPASGTSFLNFSNDRFLKGLLIGAAAAYVLTNEHVQRGAIKGVVKAWTLLQGGMEELKERFHDAEAEIRASEQEP